MSATRPIVRGIIDERSFTALEGDRFRALVKISRAVVAVVVTSSRTLWGWKARFSGIR